MEFKTLKDVPSDKAFVFCNGSRAQNLYQLADTIEHSGDGIFGSHVQGERNDFAQWILDVLEDTGLFDLLRHENNKYWFVQKVRGHLKFLEGMA